MIYVDPAEQPKGTKRRPQPPVSDLLGLFDAPTPAQAASRSARDAGMQKAHDHAAERWRQAVRDAVMIVSYAMPTFTTEDIWQALEQAGKDPLETERNPKAMGPMMAQLAREGLIVATGEFRENTRRHSSPSRVWRKATTEEYRNA